MAGLRRHERDTAMDDPVKLRTALLVACMRLCQNDPDVAIALYEELYDSADDLLNALGEQDAVESAVQAAIVPFKKNK